MSGGLRCGQTLEINVYCNEVGCHATALYTGPVIGGTLDEIFTDLQPDAHIEVRRSARWSQMSYVVYISTVKLPWFAGDSFPVFLCSKMVF